MSPPPLPLPLDHHIFISNNNNTNTLDSGRIDLLLSLALPTPATLSLSPNTPADYGQKQKPSLTLSLLFPAAATQQNLSTNSDDISSFSNSFVSIKREREDHNATVNNNDVSNTGGSSCGGNNTPRKKKKKMKKLRLSKQQSALLEDSFKLHTTLSHKQKEALARQLNLRPRQVEVWFQNRRARTKLKQTEVDCEFLKKCCERLAEENEKLHKELQHLKSFSKQQQPFYMHRLTNYKQYCPSCHQQQQVPADNTSNNFLISSKKRIIFNPCYV